MRLHPVTGWVVRPDHAAAVATPPYDALDADERAAFVAAHPTSYLAVLPEQVAPPATRGAGLDDLRARLEDLLETAFEPVDTPVLGLLELTDEDHRQLGIVGDVALDESRIHIHEATQPARVQQMVRFLDAVGVASSPVALAVDDRTDAGAAATAAAAEAARATAPRLAFTTVDGVRVRLWLLADGPEARALGEALAAVDALTIVDGHHRAAAQRRHGGSDRLLAVVFPAAELRIEAFDRLVRPVPGGPAGLPDRLRTSGLELRGLPAPRRPQRRGEVTVISAAGAWRLALPAAPGGVAGLDVSLLHEQVLGTALGIAGLDHPDVAAVHAADPAELAARAGTDGAAFALHPVTPDTLLAIAASGEVMPPKSTYVTPKVRSGLLVVPRHRGGPAPS